MEKRFGALPKVVIPYLTAVLESSPFLASALLRHEGESETNDRFWSALGHPEFWTKSKPQATMLQELESEIKLRPIHDIRDLQKRLREYKLRETVRIAGRDLLQCPFEDTGHDLASLAAVSLECAYRGALTLSPEWKFLPAFCILGMGKLGGDDLNFSSDVDLLYVHESSSQDARQLLASFTALSELVTRLLHERTEDGFVFRVDLDLRPEGKSGVLVNSLEALVSYYEASGAAWEKTALIKARPVAGDPTFGSQIVAQLQPFIYPRTADDGVIHDLKSMKTKIHEDWSKKSNASSSMGRTGFNVKIGVGGIREIEFFTAAFQRIFGGKDPDLRERNTLRCLGLLKDKKLIPAEDANGLREAYVFLRTLENRLQMKEDRQTHTLPTCHGELEAVSRAMGFPSVDAFYGEMSRHTQLVSRCFTELAS